jgi:hypothetical protein
VCDADVLVHARCGEVRRIPVTFENDTRRERVVTLALDSFKTAGGRDLKWAVQLSETTFTLRGCDERTITVAVQVRCDMPDAAPTPADSNNPNVPGVGSAQPAGTAVNTPRVGSVDHCEVAYATLRADGCLIRPVVIAVALHPLRRHRPQDRHPGQRKPDFAPVLPANDDLAFVHGNCTGRAGERIQHGFQRRSQREVARDSVNCPQRPGGIQHHPDRGNLHLRKHASRN